jgi:hypothetical protein
MGEFYVFFVTSIQKFREFLFSHNPNALDVEIECSNAFSPAVRSVVLPVLLARMK